MSYAVSNLAEARQLLDILNQCERKLDETRQKAERTKLSYADLYNAIQDVFTLLDMAGLPPHVADAVSRIHTLIIALNSLRVAILAFEAATLAAGPAGWALATLGLAVGAVGSFAGIARATGRRVSR